MNLFNIEDILKEIEYLDFIGNKSVYVSKMISLDKSNTSDNILSWCSDKNHNNLIKTTNGTYIISNKIDIKDLNQNCNFIIVENPRLCFKNILSTFFVKEKKYQISKTASIHDSAKLGENIFIGNNVVIEENCVIGNNVLINHNTVIFEGTIIGNHVVIGANNTIGGIGFGYEKNKSGEFELIPHIGNVILSNHVEIGNNTTIDRAVLGSTFLDSHVKVDNLVHIAHGVKIGKNSVIIANSMIAGSVEIGHDVWVAPSSSILNKKTVGNHALIGLSAVVIRNVDDKEIVVGNPAKKIN